jgi:hypothetical protein
MSKGYLYNLASRMPQMVHRRKKAKKQGGFRVITSPNSELKDVLRLINEKVLGQFTLHNFLFLQPGCNHIKMLSQFRGVRFVITADVDDFYPSIYPAMVTKTLLNLGFDNPSAKLLTRLMTSYFELPQGFPTSPIIAALSLNPVLLRLDGLAHKEKFLIGLYADNLVIGTSYTPQRFHNLFVKIFKQSGFLLEEFKVYCDNSPREVMGIRIGTKLEVEPSYIKSVTLAIESFIQEVDKEKSNNILKSIKGKISYIDHVNSQQAASLKKMIKDLI